MITINNDKYIRVHQKEGNSIAWASEKPIFKTSEIEDDIFLFSWNGTIKQNLFAMILMDSSSSIELLEALDPDENNFKIPFYIKSTSFKVDYLGVSTLLVFHASIDRPMNIGSEYRKVSTGRVVDPDFKTSEACDLYGKMYFTIPCADPFNSSYVGMLKMPE
jgi:hypothetical protein